MWTIAAIPLIVIAVAALGARCFKSEPDSGDDQWWRAIK